MIVFVVLFVVSCAALGFASPTEKRQSLAQVITSCTKSNHAALTFVRHLTPLLQRFNLTSSDIRTMDHGNICISFLLRASEIMVMTRRIVPDTT